MHVLCVYYCIMYTHTQSRGKCQYLYLIKGSSSNKTAKTPITRRPATMHIILYNTGAACPRAFGFINYINIRGTPRTAFCPRRRRFRRHRRLYYNMTLRLTTILYRYL
jgi:hypothetical protein